MDSGIADSQSRRRVVGQANPHYFLSRLNANADFRVLLADRIYRQFFNDGPLTPAKVDRPVHGPRG